MLRAVIGKELKVKDRVLVRVRMHSIVDDKMITKNIEGSIVKIIPPFRSISEVIFSAYSIFPWRYENVSSEYRVIIKCSSAKCSNKPYIVVTVGDHRLGNTKSVRVFKV